jgi:tRNA(fMet)-specific endonuclease VapC
MIFLLDSNVWVAILRQKSGQVTARYGACNRADIRTCSMVLAELWYGCAKSARPAANRAVVDALLAPIARLLYDDAAADRFVTIRCHLESIGKMIGPYDAQIAAIALAYGCTLVTHNTAEFNRVPGLQLEDWQTP